MQLDLEWKNVWSNFDSAESKGFASELEPGIRTAICDPFGITCNVEITSFHQFQPPVVLYTITNFLVYVEASAPQIDVDAHFASVTPSTITTSASASTTSITIDVVKTLITPGK